MEFIVFIAMRLMAACICAAGAVWLAHDGKAGWGWMLFAALVLGGFTIHTTKKSTKSES